MHDWGGAIGMTAFGAEPDRVRKIVLLNTAAFPSRDVPRRILFAGFLPRRDLGSCHEWICFSCNLDGIC